jgi:hypothetical protein
MNGVNFERIKANFLIPMERTVASHYPFREAASLCSVSCTFPQFVKQMYFFEDTRGFDCRHESHPFDSFNVKKGWVKMLFSCRKAVEWISARIERKDETWSPLKRVYTACRILQKVGDRVHFELALVFPEPGQYRTTLFLDRIPAVRFHPYAVRGTDQLPYKPVLATKFDGEVLSPEAALSVAPDGAALIKIRLLKKYVNFKITFATVERATFIGLVPGIDGKNFVKSTRVDDPEDRARAILAISIAFPSTGLQEVSLALLDGETWVHAMVVYFDVILPKTDSPPDPSI